MNKFNINKMSKLLLFLLIALIQNTKSADITVYDKSRMKRLTGNVFVIDVKEGDVFHLRFSENPSRYQFWRFINYEEIPDALDCYDGKSFSEPMEPMSWKEFREWIQHPLIGGTGYRILYKFKALKPSINEIALKFKYSIGNYIEVIKVNIHPKDGTS